MGCLASPQQSICWSSNFSIVLVILHSCDKQLRESFKGGNRLFWCTVSEGHPTLVWLHELWQIIMTVGTRDKESRERGRRDKNKILSRISPHVNFFPLSPSVNVSKGFSAGVTRWRYRVFKTGTHAGHFFFKPKLLSQNVTSSWDRIFMEGIILKRNHQGEA